MPELGRGGQPGTVPYYLVEIPVLETSKLEVERAMRTLRAAGFRLAETASAPRVLLAGMAAGEGRLLCIVEACSTQTVRRLVALGLLPDARVRMLTDLLASGPSSERLGSGSVGGRGPSCDSCSGVETEFVQDVADVGLHGPFGEE